MSGAKVSSIAASLGSIQHMRQVPAGPRATASPDTRIPASPRLVPDGSAKRSHPDYAQLKAYVRKDTKRAAMRKAEDQGYEDFSALVQKLLDEYLGR